MDTGGMFAGYILKVNSIAFTREGKQEWLGQSPRTFRGQKEEPGKDGEENGSQRRARLLCFQWEPKGRRR